MAARTHTNVTTVNLASSTAKKVQSTDEILKQIESTMPDASQQNMAQRQGGLSARLQGRINEHELAYGDKSLPRQRLPKVGNVLLDRYQAARHNVLVLGAIQQVEAKSKSNTHRSGKGAGGSHTPARPGSRAGASSLRGSRISEAGDTEGQDESSWEAGGLSAGRTGLDSESDSFKSRVSSKALGSIAEDLLSAQPSGANLNPEASQISSKAGRRFNRQGSNSSIASRVSAVSYASGLTSVSRASSSGRHMRQQPSYLSSGGSSGHTLRSHRTGSVAGSSWGGHHRKGGKRKPPQPEPGRVTRAFAEFGSKDDWVSKTLLKHALAAIIQARWRGHWVRMRWKVNKEQLVLDEREHLEAEASHHARLQELQHKLALYQQKKLARAAAEAEASADGDAGVRPALAANAGAAGAAGALPGAGVGGGGVSRAASAAWRKAGAQLSAVASLRSLKSAGEASYQAEGQAGAWLSDCDSGWSDIELDDVAAIKFRAVTPPWQRGAERQQMSLALQQRTAAAAAATMGLEPSECQAAVVAANWDVGLGGLGSCWEDDADDTTAKLQELRHRRICRKPEPVPLSAPAVAAAATAGLLAAPPAADDDTAGPSTSSAAAADDDDGGAGEAGLAAAAGALPQHVVEALLLDRYREKYSRLGLPHKMPGRRRWAKMQAAAAAAAAAADGGAEGGELPEVQGPASGDMGGLDSAGPGLAAGGQAVGLDGASGGGPATQAAQ